MKLYVTVNHEIICQPYNVLNNAHKLFLANQKRVLNMANLSANGDIRD